MKFIFVIILIAIGIVFSVSIIHGQKESIADIIFVTTNATAESFSAHEFNVTINNITSHNETNL